MANNFQGTQQNMFDQNLIIGLVVLAVVVFAIYAYAPRVRAVLSGLGFEGFANHTAGAKKMSGAAAMKTPGANPSLGGMNNAKQVADAMVPTAAPKPVAPVASAGKEGFANFEGSPFGASETMGPVPMAGAQKPQGCYPREQLNPSELLPADMNSQWAQVNPTGAGDIQGKNFLSAGALVGVNTIGQSLRNANYQLRAEPPNPQNANVSPWMVSTIEPDLQRRPLD
jgi:subtilisin family serine protease